MQRWIVGLVILLALGACAAPQGTRLDPHAVTTMRAPWPPAIATAPHVPPRILAVWMNETAVAPGTQWLGRIATTTNTASVEVRTESFSFNATRIAFGQFVFSQHVLDVVPYYKRGYTLSIIARNADGVEDTDLIPITMR